MNQPDSDLPAPVESRVDQIFRITSALSEFERDELRFKLIAMHLNDHCRRLAEPKNVIAFGLHTLTISGAVVGLAVGAVAGLMAAATSGPLQGLLWFVCGALGGGGCFGLFMAIFLVLNLRMSFKRIAKNLSSTKSSLYHVDEIELPLLADQAYDVCKTEVEAKKWLRVEALDKGNMAISATANATFRSPGELVGIKIESVPDGRVRVRIYSRALFTTTDFGKNHWNVRMLSDSIKKHGDAVSLLADYKSNENES